MIKSYYIKIPKKDIKIIIKKEINKILQEIKQLSERIYEIEKALRREGVVLY